MGDREPGLAGPCRAGAEDERMAAQRTDIGILRRGARAHRSLAQVDLLERRSRGRRVVVEQRALRDRQPDRTFDVAGNELVAALEPFVEPFEHAARLLHAVARARDGDVIAALLRDHAEPALDQCQVLSVLAEQQRMRAGCRRRRARPGRGGHRSPAAQRTIHCPIRDERKGVSPPPASVRAPERALRQRAEQAVGADLGDRHGRDVADHCRWSHDLNRLQIWGAADDLARMPSRLFEQDVEGAAEALRVERGLAGGRSPLAGDGAARISPPPAI